MEARPHIRTPSRFWTSFQPSIVRIYKITGLLCLTAILVGLVGFLTVNIFYFFDHSWVRPVVLEPHNQKVIEASHQFAEAKQRASDLAVEKIQIESQLKDIDLTVATDEKFIAEASHQTERPTTTDQWLLRREVDRARLDRDQALGRRIPLTKRLESLTARIADQAIILERLETSPYVRAAKQDIIVAFVPHENLAANISVGTSLYRCAWGLVRCSQVGEVTQILPGEVTGEHPHNQSSQRGQYVEIEVTPGAARSSVLFAGKPLWLF